MTRVAGLGSGGAGKSMSLLMKCKYLDEKTDHNACVFASGTPISNSMTEMYTIMRYLQPEKLQKAGINSFDEWASIYAEIVNSFELKPECDGKFQSKTRISRYDNFAQLMTMFGECADMKAAGAVKLPIPEHTVENIIAPATFAVKKEMLEISKRAIMLRNGYDKNGRKIDPRDDNFLKITTDGRKLGLDLRMKNPLAEDNPKSKINLCVEKVFEVYENSAESKGTQVIFCDLSTPKKENPNGYIIYKLDEDGEYNFAYSHPLEKDSTFESLNEKFQNARKLPKDYTEGKLVPGDVIVIRTTDKQGNVANEARTVGQDFPTDDVMDEFFDNVGLERFVPFDAPKRFCAYDDIREKLVAKGIPKEQIAFIHEYEKSADKQQLYQKMNEGEIRVLLGSTSKCGAGMNAQKKMIALHHLDAPMRPSDMEQREGRILRQGNENTDVTIYRYVTDRTFVCSLPCIL